MRRTGPVLVLLAALILALAATAGAVPPDSDPRVTPVVRAARAASPAVVNITSAKIVERRADVFDLFFGDSQYFGPPHGRERAREESLGSGVIIDGKRGLALTNAHVIAGASQVTVRLQDGREFAAELAASDPDFDLAVLKLSGAANLPEIKIGDSSDLMIGETVMAIGNPYGYGHTLTVGVVSALSRSLRTKDGAFTGLIQTDAAINPGNSGGPLINIGGELIGVNTAIHSGAEGIGFAIPAAKAKRVIAELEGLGHVRAVWLGLLGQSLDPRTARHLGLDKAKGMVVTEVFAGSSADKAGLKPADVITAVDGVQIEDRDHFVDVLRNYTLGETVRLTLAGGGQKNTLSCPVEEFSLTTAKALILKRWGMDLDLSKGAAVVVNVTPNSAADKVGFRRGDRLTQIGGIRLIYPNDFLSAALRHRMQNAVVLMLERSGREYYVRFQL